jgi:hypothetical protein
VTDEHDRTGQAAQELGEVGRVTSEIAKRVGEPDGPESPALQGADLGVEAVASAQAPWTRTIVGVSAAIVATAPLLTV